MRTLSIIEQNDQFTLQIDLIKRQGECDTTKVGEETATENQSNIQIEDTKVLENSKMIEDSKVPSQHDSQEEKSQTPMEAQSVQNVHHPTVVSPELQNLEEVYQKQSDQPSSRTVQEASPDI